MRRTPQVLEMRDRRNFSAAPPGPWIARARRRPPPAPGPPPRSPAAVKTWWWRPWWAVFL